MTFRANLLQPSSGNKSLKTENRTRKSPYLHALPCLQYHKFKPEYSNKRWEITPVKKSESSMTYMSFQLAHALGKSTLNEDWLRPNPTTFPTITKTIPTKTASLIKRIDIYYILIF